MTAEQEEDRSARVGGRHVEKVCPGSDVERRRQVRGLEVLWKKNDCSDEDRLKQRVCLPDLVVCVSTLRSPSN